MYDQNGAKVWECELDIYGKIRTLAGRADMCPFRYQGQYHDIETDLYYNRFRYYAPNEGGYISQDPIGVEGGFKLYTYVSDSTLWIDEFGLSSCKGTQRWKNKVRKDGKPYKKPGPKKNGKHSKKIREIIKREKAKGNTHIGGGSKTEIIIDTPNGKKPYRRADASFVDANGNVYHINVGLSNKNGTPIVREKDALSDVKGVGESMTFESYGTKK